jgi:hypothetical protein
VGKKISHGINVALVPQSKLKSKAPKDQFPSKYLNSRTKLKITKYTNAN